MINFIGFCFAFNWRICFALFPVAFLFTASLLLTLSSFFRKELWLARSLGKGQISSVKSSR